MEAARSWPDSTTVIEVQSYHRLASFYRRFVSHFSSIMTLITSFIKEGKFHWTPETTAAFELIKTKPTTVDILVLPNFSETFEFHSDASKLGIDAVISQRGWPISYYSEKLASPHSRYSTFNMEFYVIIQAIKH